MHDVYAVALLSEDGNFAFFCLVTEQGPLGIFVEAVDDAVEEEKTFARPDGRLYQSRVLLKNHRPVSFKRSDIVIIGGEEVHHTSNKLKAVSNKLNICF